MKSLAAILRKMLLVTSCSAIGALVLFLAAELIFRILPNRASIERKYSGQLVRTADWYRAARVYNRPNQQFVWVGNPGTIQEFAVKSSWNSHGFNDSEHSFENPDHLFRIVILGGANVEALQVPREKSFHQLLEDKLNANGTKNFEVIALGSPRHGPRRNHRLLQELGLKYKPDLILTEFSPTEDVLNDSVALEVLRRRQIQRLNKISATFRPIIYRVTSESAFPIRYSRLFPILAQNSFELKFRSLRTFLSKQDQIPLHYFVYSETYDVTWERSWQMTLQYIRNIRDVAEAAGSKYLLVSFDDQIKLSKEDLDDLFSKYPAMKHFQWDFDHPQKIISRFCKENGIPVFDLERPFKQAYLENRAPFHFQYDGHWNEAGHKLAGEKIFDYLVGAGLIGS
jgi:hypothetical protein